jgi:hypothetical protein
MSTCYSESCIKLERLEDTSSQNSVLLYGLCHRACEPQFVLYGYKCSNFVAFYADGTVIPVCCASLASDFLGDFFSLAPILSTYSGYLIKFGI